jgi:tRNA (cytidine/uridine-2'-O-)-methyltransferase
VVHDSDHSAGARGAVDVVAAPLLHLVLDRPAIAGNVGACVRLAAATGATLHICGSTLDPQDRELWRPGLDYWPLARVHFHHHLSDCLHLLKRPPWIIEVGGDHAPWDVDLDDGDVVVFGPEKGSVEDGVRYQDPARILTLPQQAGVRSLNLSQVVAVVAFEATRQRTKRGGATADAGKPI